MDKVVSVQKEFKKNNLADLLVKAGGYKPKLPCPTRWTSQRGACNSFMKNLAAMKTETSKMLMICL